MALLVGEPGPRRGEVSRGASVADEDLLAGVVREALRRPFRAVAEERRADAEASNSYYSEYNQRVVILKKNAETYTDFNTLAGAKLAVQKGSVQLEIAKAHLYDCELVELQSAEDMFYRLAIGEVDAVLVAGSVADSYTAANTALVIMEQEFPESEGCSVWVAKDDPKGLMEQINQTVDYVKINNLYNGWLDQAAELNR